MSPHMGSHVQCTGYWWTGPSCQLSASGKLTNLLVRTRHKWCQPEQEYKFIPDMGSHVHIVHMCRLFTCADCSRVQCIV